MIHSRARWTLAGMAGLTSLTFFALAASGDPKTQSPNQIPNGSTPRVTPSLRGVERDVRKMVIESPTNRMIAAKSGAAVAFVNPKFKAGSVCWHGTFAAACTASAKSKKPVLLFHLMGKLDEQFC